MFDTFHIRYTWQIRICDSNLDHASDKAVSQLSSLIRNVRINDRLYDEFLVNQKFAAIHGLQAVFEFGGEKREAADLLREIIELAKPGLEKLGAAADDLELINQMLQKRQTQADMALALINRYNDLQAFYMAFAHVLKNFDAFEEYLTKAPTLQPQEMPSIEDFTVSKLDMRSSYWFLNMKTGMPAVSAGSWTNLKKTGGFKRKTISQVG